MGLRPYLEGDAGGVNVGDASVDVAGVAFGDGVVAGEGVARRDPCGDGAGDRDGLTNGIERTKF